MKIIVVVTVLVMLLAITSVVSAATIYVPDDYQTINAAISAASPGDTILVRSGTYYENVVLNKCLSLIGEGLPTIDAQYKENAITITADGCRVKGFRCVKTFNKAAGIRVKAGRNIIEDNICEGNMIDIHILNTSRNEILNNTCKGCREGGSREGILLQHSTRNKILNNTFKNCSLFPLESYDNEVEGNTVNGKPLVYKENVSGAEITDAGQVILVNCEGITVRDCNIAHTTVGIQLFGSSNCTIKNNRVLDNYFGISLLSSRRNKILKNTCEDNGRGIHLQHSSMNRIRNNTFMNCGLHIAESYDNEVEGNIVNGKPLVYLENVSGATITDAGQVILVKCKGICVRDCNIHHISTGIELWESFNCSIEKNKIHSSSWDGIYLRNSSRNKILYNHFKDNQRGVYLFDASENNISNNLFNNFRITNVVGIYLRHSSKNKATNNAFRNCGIHIVAASYDNEVEGNIVNGKPLVYLENVSGVEITEAGQVILVKCEEITVRDCNISRTTVGIQLWKSSNCTIENNKVVENAWGGISLWDSAKNTISNNTCEKNDDSIHLIHSSGNKILKNKVCNNDFLGISLWYSPRNTISRNSIYDNDFFGILLRYSSNNLIHLNDFVNNNPNVCSYNSDNIWNSTRPLTYDYVGKTYKNYLGNYWSDYPGEDVDGDGIGDTSYKVDEDDYDYYPRIQPLEFYSKRIENTSLEIIWDNRECMAGDEPEPVFFPWEQELEVWNWGEEMR